MRINAEQYDDLISRLAMLQRSLNMMPTATQLERIEQGQNILCERLDGLAKLVGDCDGSNERREDEILQRINKLEQRLAAAKKPVTATEIAATHEPYEKLHRAISEAIDKITECDAINSDQLEKRLLAHLKRLAKKPAKRGKRGKKP